MIKCRSVKTILVGDRIKYWNPILIGTKLHQNKTSQKNHKKNRHKTASECIYVMKGIYKHNHFMYLLLLTQYCTSEFYRTTGGFYVQTENKQMFFVMSAP